MDRISHANTECLFKPKTGGAAGYGEWSKAAPIRDVLEAPRPLTHGVGDMRHVGVARNGLLPPSQEMEHASRSRSQVGGSSNVLVPR